MKFEANQLPQTKEGLLEYIETLLQKYNTCETENAKLKNDKEGLEAANQKLSLDVLWLEEQLATRNRKLFGRSSENLSAEEIKGWLFDEAELTVVEEKPEAEVEVEVEGETVEVPAHTRKKPGRRKLPEALPRHDIVHDLPVEEKACACCGKERPRIGEDATEELEYVPAKLMVNRHVYPKYGPCGCERSKADETIRPIVTAPAVKRLIPGGMAGPGLLAHLATCKFADGLPFYRMEKILARYGIEYPRSTMCRQMIAVSRACQDLLKLMWEDARGSPLLHLDETTVQVLKEPERSPSQKSYMWVTVGYRQGKKIVLFHYHQSRSKAVAEELTKGYRGYIQTDGYAAYSAVGEREGIVHVGCWGHARRKFFEALQGKHQPSLAQRALILIGKLFAIDKKYRALWESGKLTADEFVAKRRAKSLPVLAQIKTWVDAHIALVTPSSHLGDAMKYVTNQWKKLLRYLDHPYLHPDNNIVENAIRPFVIGRKNWLFADTPLGAYASATLYSFIESAKANGLDPYAYLKYLFTILPITHKEKLIDLLPHRIDPALLQ
jgi:transposase